MPDTGAPWNIPYADPTDLVRDWPDLSEDVADAVALGLSNASVVTQYVRTQKNDSFSTSSGTYVDVTGLAATITPTSATSLVMVVMSVAFGNSANNNNFFLVTDGSDSAIAPHASLTTDHVIMQPGPQDSNETMVRATAVLWDAPGSTAAKTYKVRMFVVAGTGHVNQRAVAGRGSSSSITLIEFAP